MDFELVVVQGRSLSSSIKLGDGVTTVGRHDECQLRIKSAQVSRKHCELFEKKGLLLVKDLGSSNGTIVNGKRIQGQRVLEAGDELTIGPIQFKVSRIGAPAVAAGKPGGKPGDTAVNAAIGAEGDDFTLDDDATTQALPVASPAQTPPPKAAPKAAPKPKPAPVDDEAFADFLIDLPMDGDEETETVIVPAASQPAPAAPASAAQAGPVAKSAPAPAKHAEPKEEEPAAEKDKIPADDAIADFLLDIKIDDEE